MSKKLIILIGATIFLIGSAIIFQLGNFGTGFLWTLSGEGTWLLPLVAAAALIDSINPCAFGILLLTITFLLSISKARSGILRIGGVYILGLFVVYILIGLGILQTLHLFNSPHFMAKIGAGALVLFGIINLIGQFFPAFPIKLGIPQAVHHKIAELMNKASLPTAFLLGVLVGICEFPCTGGPYLMVLGLLHDQGTYLSGVGYLLFYNLIFILPLVLILFIAGNRVLVDKIQRWKKMEVGNMKFWGGIAMIVLGLATFFL